MRAERQAIVREAELADRRLAALAADRTGWVERQQGARKQIATLEQRIVEARARPYGAWKMHPRFSPRNGGALNHRGADRGNRAAGLRRPTCRPLKTALGRQPTATRVPRWKPPAQLAKNLPAPRSASRQPSAGLAISAEEIRDMLEIEPSAVAELAEIGPTDPLARISPKLKRSLNVCAASVNAWARSTFAPRKNCARLRSQHSLAHHRTRRPGRGDQEAAARHPEPQPRSTRAAAAPHSSRSTNTSSTSSPSCSAAGPPSCS